MVVPEASINNIMGGLESTAGVRLHNHRRKLKQRFDIVRKLGQGTYGKVQLGINKETGQEVAIKTIKKCKIETEADLIRIRREIQIMSSVQHPNIIHIYEVFENREKMVLVMEYAAGGELYDYISEKKVLNEAEARRIFRQIATAVYYCHKHKICHRDLKLENVLLDEHGSAKIADFGLSNVFDETHLLGTFCGSPLYASPEIVKGTPYHGPEVDCWSLGVLLYTLVYGSMPFDGSNFKRLVRQISQGDYFEPKKPSPASPLIAEMLKVNASRRADIVAICSHWWIDNQESVPCLEVAEELANQTPVRLDLLLSLAPSACAGDKLLIPEQGTLEEEAASVSDCPVRSQSLGSLAVTQPIDFLAEEAQRSKKTAEAKPEATTERRKERSKSKRRERSSSRNRKRDESTPESDSYTEKPHRKSSKSKKKQQKMDEPKKADESNTSVVDESMTEVKEVKKEEDKEDRMADDDVKTSEVAEILQTISQLEKDYKAEDAAIEKGEVSLDDYKMETAVVAGGEEKVTKEGGMEDVKTDVEEGKVDKVDKEQEKEEPPKEDKTPKQTTDNKKEAKKVDSKTEDDKPSKPMERRKSKIFETAEKFSQMQESAVKPPPKKVFLPGVKVSDAKKAYERKSSLASSSSVLRPNTSGSRRNSTTETSLSRRGSVAENTSPSAEFDRKFSLASTVALNKLVEDVEKLARDEEAKEKKMREKEEKKMKEKEEKKDGAKEKTEMKAEGGAEAKQSKEDTAKPVVEEKKSADKVVSDEKANAKAPTPEKAKEKSVSPPGDTTHVKKIQNAVQVIGNAIDTNNGEKKAATLPRRKTSRAEIKLTTPKTSKPEFRSEVEHMVAAAPPPAPAAPASASVQRSEVVFPVAAAVTSHPVRSATLPPTSPQPQKPPMQQPKLISSSSEAAAGAAPREHIIPIRFEAGDERPPVKVKEASAGSGQKPVSRTNSKSLSRQSTADSDSGSVVSQGEPIRKSPREVIIPIAVEGGGFVTPNLEAVNRMSSLTESDDESSATHHGFSLHSTRRPHKQLDTADSVSSDEDDDNFEILTAESLFSALLSKSFAQRRKDVISRLSPDSLLVRDSWIGDKVRNLTHRLNTEETRPPGFPRLFNHHSLFENSPSFSSRRLSEARSFNRADVPWRRSMSRDSSSTLPRDFSTRSALRPSLLHSRSIEPGTSKLPRRSPSLSLRQGDEKPPVYRQKFPRNLVPESSDGALDVTNENRTTATNSKSPRQSLARDDNGNRYSLQDEQVVDNGSRGFSTNLQDKQVVDNGTRSFLSNLQGRQSLIGDVVNRTQGNDLQDRQSIKEMVDERIKRNSREETSNKSFSTERKSMIKETLDEGRGRNIGDDSRRSENRSFSSSISERQSMIRELGDERGKMNMSPYLDEKHGYSSNSDLSDSYRTAKNSRSVPVEKNSSEMSSSGKRLGERMKNSYSDLSEASYSSRKLSSPKMGNRKSGDDFLANGDVRSRKSSINEVTKLEGVRREFNRSASTDRRRFSYIDGTLSSPYTSSRVTDSLRTRRHSKDFSLTSSGSFNDRITARDIEKFRSEFRRTNSSVENSRLKTSDSANNNLTDLTENNNSPSNDGCKSVESSSNQQQNLNDVVDNSGGAEENGDASKKLSSNSGGQDSNGNVKLKNINVGDDLMKYKKPESPLMFAVKESSYQKPLTNNQYSTRRKSYISSVLDREGSLRNSSHLETGPDFRRSISLNQGNEELKMMGSRNARSHSVTPDRSVLGKYLETEKQVDSKLINSNSVLSGVEKVVDSKLSNNVEGNDVGDSRMNLKSRRVSRFLRPDFYDTPREESVYVKNDGEEKLLKKESVKSKEVEGKKKSRVKETIRSLRESSLPKECDLAVSESTLIKRAVSLDDCSVVGGSSKSKASRSKRASSVSSDRRVILEPLAKIESFIKKKMSTDKRKKKVEREEKTEENKEEKSKDSVVTRLARRISPKLVKNFRRRSCVGAPFSNCENGAVDLDFGNGYKVDKSSSLEGNQSRASRIANLKKLDFTKPHRSADSTPSFDDYDESSLMLLSPNDDNSDSWSAASDYMDARDFTVSPTAHSGAEESVSERIRRKSFYSRFNQLKKKKTTSSSSQVGALSPRLSSRLPTYRKSMSSSLPISGGNVGNEQQIDK